MKIEKNKFNERSNLSASSQENAKIPLVRTADFINKRRPLRIESLSKDLIDVQHLSVNISKNVGKVEQNANVELFTPSISRANEFELTDVIGNTSSNYNRIIGSGEDADMKNFKTNIKSKQQENKRTEIENTETTTDEKSIERDNTSFVNDSGRLDKGNDYETKSSLGTEQYIRQNCEDANMDFYQIDEERVLLTMVYPCSLYFTGVLSVEVLTGSVDVLGYSFDRSSIKQIIYSPQGFSKLCITAGANGKIDRSVIEKLSRSSIDEEKIESLVTKFGDNSIIVILKNDKPFISSFFWPNVIKRYADVTLLPPVMPEVSPEKICALECEFYTNQTSAQFYLERPQWKEISILAVADSSKTILCGGNNVGKSTMLRYLVNKSLSTHQKVLVLDFDPGQSEFTVPGCLSAFLVDSPLLGPNFTHLLKPLRSLFLGEISPCPCVNRYFVCMDDLISFCNSSFELQKMPWFINTMGFTKGLGIRIAASLITMLSPTVLVQIQGNKGVNFPQLLTPNFVKAQNDLGFSNPVENPQVLNYKLFEIPTAVKNYGKAHGKGKAVGSLGSLNLRNIVILSYFKQMFDTTKRDAFNTGRYVVNVSDIHIKVIDKNAPDHCILNLINEKMVALCNNVSYDRDSLNYCLGFGYIRGVNKEKQQIFLSTPLDENVLCDVNTLVVGNIPLPVKFHRLNLLDQ